MWRCGNRSFRANECSKMWLIARSSNGDVPLAERSVVLREFIDPSECLVDVGVVQPM